MNKYLWIDTYNHREESIKADNFIEEEDRVTFFDLLGQRIGFLPTGTFRNLKVEKADGKTLADAWREGFQMGLVTSKAENPYA